MSEQSVNNVIKQARKAAKISQTTFARRLGMSLRQYQYYESGEGRLSMDLLQDICKQLDLVIIIAPKDKISMFGT